MHVMQPHDIDQSSLETATATFSQRRSFVVTNLVYGPARLRKHAFFTTMGTNKCGVDQFSPRIPDSMVHQIKAVMLEVSTC